MYAVVDLKGHQYIVKQGDKIVVDNVKQQEWESIKTEKVLASFDEEWNDVKLGTPYIEDASVDLKVVENRKWKKVNVVKFHNKNRYHKKHGFRPHESVLEVQNLSV